MKFHAFLCVLVSVLCTSPAFAQQIGVVVAASPTVGIESSQGNRPSASVGDPIHQGDVITTTPNAAVQVIFDDQTVLSIGPSTEIEITSFVYDGNPSTADMVLTLLRGACRIIGGLVTTDNAASVTSVSGVVGIRGSTAIVHVDESSGTTTAIFVDGDQMCMTGNGGEETCTSRRGGVLAQGLYSGSVDSASVARILRQLRGG